MPPLAVADADLPFEALVATDAVRLFAARAAGGRSGLRARRDGAPAVAAICARLDGLPLAIELAAARAKLLAPAEILEPARARGSTCSAGGPRDAPGPPADAARDDRLELRPARPRRANAFARLGVFAGGFTLEAAEGVCDVTLDSLATLVDNSLLRRRDGRFRMLETVRRFALERLEDAECHRGPPHGMRSG